MVGKQTLAGKTNEVYLVWGGHDGFQIRFTEFVLYFEIDPCNVYQEDPCKFLKIVTPNLVLEISCDIHGV